MFFSITTRMRALVEAKLPKYGRFQELERLTKIKNATWQKWARGGQRATEQMIQAVACVWPEHAYWLVTGDELLQEGMTNPMKKHTREIQTLKEFTAQTLGMRLAIRDEFAGTSLLNQINSEDGDVDEATLEKFAKLIYDRAANDVTDIANGQEIKNALTDDAFEADWIEQMAGDIQLQELEKTRHRLMIQILEKGGTAAKIKGNTK
jgi:hypothetical protein